MIANVAYSLHTPIGELMEMEWPEVMEWHRQCERIAEHLDRQGQT